MPDWKLYLIVYLIPFPFAFVLRAYLEAKCKRMEKLIYPINRESVSDMSYMSYMLYNFPFDKYTISVILWPFMLIFIVISVIFYLCIIVPLSTCYKGLVNYFERKMEKRWKFTK